MTVKSLAAVLVIALGCILQTGCAMYSNRNGADRISQKTVSPGDGILIVSIGAPDTCGAAAWDSHLSIKRGDDSPLPELGVIFIDSHYDKSEYPDHHGRLLVIPIPAGNYYFMVPLLSTFYAGPMQVPKFNFSIAPGEVLYAGELWLSTHCKFNVPSTVEFRDQKQRDLQLIREKNPEFAQSRTIVKRVPVLSGYVVDQRPR